MNETSRRHKAEAPTCVGFAVVVCSSSRYQDLKARKPVDDPSGDLIVETLQKADHNVVFREIVPDDKVLIGKYVSRALGSEKVGAIIVCGGTGISPKDVTIEAVRPMLVKTLPGFGELFRKLSFDEIGSAAVLTRALAGVADQGKAVFCIPGSPQAVRLVLEKLILPEVGHILKHAREK
ncbi:MAG: MogA/MoaB family molybdenum cofactor biosynthesis protein [Candidatus Bathyarchaeota archaeon]|nr:MogA/MoaB family molybdenum cofactor biosynthesis protein [Candidatus Bathyarchaeota archaeon]